LSAPSAVRNSHRRMASLVLALGVATSLLTAGTVSEAAVRSAPAPAPSAAPRPVPPAAASLPGPVPPPPVPYRVNSYNLQSLTWDQLWTNGGPLQGYAAGGHKDADGIPMRKWGDGKWYYTPVKIEIQGIVRLDSYVRTGNDPGYIPTLVKFADKLRSLGVWSGDALFLPMPFDFNLGQLKAPWYNAMAQGYGLSFFVRMYRLFGNQADLDTANALFRSFQIMGPIDGPWVSQVVNNVLWLEHYPKGKYLEVLNAHMHALFGLYDYWQQVGTAESRQILEGVMTTMRHDLPLFRRIGSTSRYCLVHPVYSLKYHRLHIKQVRLLAIASGDPWFSGMADRLESDAH
jgi:D-glucuronyl C5-epimerase C-terminus